MAYTSRPSRNSWDRSRGRSSSVDHRKQRFFTKWGYISRILMRICMITSTRRGGSRRDAPEARTVL